MYVPGPAYIVPALEGALMIICGNFSEYFCRCVENILLRDFAHLCWCDTCVERRGKTDNDCFIVSIFAEGVQSLEQSFVEIFAGLYRFVQYKRRHCEENSCSEFFTCLAWEKQWW